MKALIEVTPDETDPTLCGETCQGWKSRIDNKGKETPIYCGITGEILTITLHPINGLTAMKRTPACLQATQDADELNTMANVGREFSERMSRFASEQEDSEKETGE